MAAYLALAGPAPAGAGLVPIVRMMVPGREWAEQGAVRIITRSRAPELPAPWIALRRGSDLVVTASTRRIMAALAVLTLSVFAPGPAGAQYFGRNKVQYRTFDFKILRTEHFDLYYYEDEREAAVIAGRMAERWYARLSKVLHHQLSRRQPIILYAAHSHFEQTNVLEGDIGE